MNAPLSREQAVQKLARRLYENKARLDPSGASFVSWDEQTEYVRHLHTELIEDLLLHVEVLAVAMTQAQL